MKKIIYTIIILVLFGIGGILISRDNSSKIKVAEVAHSVFYAPQYVADSLGYFKDEGLDVELILTSGADKVTSAVLSGDVQIGFCGSEATIYVYNGGEKDYLVNFSGLTKRDGSFLVSRDKIDNFNLKMLENKYVIGGRKGGMPEMTLEWALKQNGVNINNVNIDTSIAFASMEGAFIGGTGDFVSLFEPNASRVEKEGLGYIVGSIGEYGGIVPYTAYNAKKSYIEKNPKVIEGFTKAIQKGLDYVHHHSDEDVAKAILSYFPDTSLNDLTNIIKNYRSIDAWFDTTTISEKDFVHIEEIMEAAGELETRVPYNKLVLQK